MQVISLGFFTVHCLSSYTNVPNRLHFNVVTDYANAFKRASQCIDSHRPIVEEGGKGWKWKEGEGRTRGGIPLALAITTKFARMCLTLDALNWVTKMEKKERN